MNMSIKIVVLAAVACFVSAPVLAQPNPTEAQNAIGRNNPCADPWVSYAVSVVKSSPGVVGRAVGSGSSHECNTQLYNGGSWGSYAELIGHVRQTLTMLTSQGAKFDMVRGAPAIVVTNPQPAMLIGQDGAGFISNDGGSFISNNGGTIVPTGYRLQSADGARLSLRLPGGRALRVR
jgi:hypothetical protein